MRWFAMMGCWALAGLLLVGCPQDDDDMADDDAGDDDAADDDSAGDDDAGDDDTAGSGGTVDVTGPSPCGPVASALRIHSDNPLVPLEGIMVSTEAHGCQTYVNWLQTKNDADAVFNPAYDQAVVDRNCTAACQALTTYYQTLQAVEDQLYPPGSCLLNVRPDQYVPGFYDVEDGLGTGMSARLMYPQSSYYQAALDVLGDCNQYYCQEWEDWDNQWAPVIAQASQAAEDTRVWWEATAGEMALDGVPETPHVTTTGMAIAEIGGGGSGTMDFDLQAAYCEIN